VRSVAAYNGISFLKSTGVQHISSLHSSVWVHAMPGEDKILILAANPEGVHVSFCFLKLPYCGFWGDE
jgi:hypothetical protein